MKTTIATPEYFINGFSATHIIFDNSHYATIWAKCRVNNQLQDVHLVLSFDKLNDLMRFAGINGEKILLSMVDEMMHKTEPPYMIRLKNIIGFTPTFTSVRLKVCTGTIENNTINNCFYVEEVWPINILQQAKNLVQHTKDFKNINVISQDVLNTSLVQLKEMYVYYLGLMELDILESACREKANLADDRLFAMAKSSWEKI